MKLEGSTMLRWFRARRRGAVVVEYALLLMAVGVPAVVGLTAGGVQMLTNYRDARNAMLAPFP
jgi:Flp pilus assembly pilin Flp